LKLCRGVVQQHLYLIFETTVVGCFQLELRLQKCGMLKEPLLLSTFYDMFFPPLNMLICFRPMFDVADNCTLSSGSEGVDMICSSRRYLHLVSFCLFSSVLEFLESLLLECSDCVVQDGADNICSVDC
jgi:hypothetical protein